MTLLTREFGAAFDPENDSLIFQEVNRISVELAGSVETWLIDSGVTQENAREFELEYDTIKMEYRLKRNGELVSFFAIHYEVGLV